MLTVGSAVPQVLQLLKAGKAKEVSYNALASHIISEDGDNPEVGEAREVFDLPVVKVRGLEQGSATGGQFSTCSYCRDCRLLYLEISVLGSLSLSLTDWSFLVRL